MNRENIRKSIIDKLSENGIEAETSPITDIVVDREFFAAGLGTGSRKIKYNTQIFINEKDKTVYMYEKTTETGAGLSSGSEMNTSFQSGKTLFRKVKIVKYGLDGKEVELKVDLGIIPKTVKETAKEYGWKFKTVMTKKKSEFPEGYVLPEKVNTATETNKEPESSKTKFCINCGRKIVFNSKFCEYCGYRQDAETIIENNNEPKKKQTEPVNNPPEDKKAKKVKEKNVEKKVKKENRKSGILEFLLLIILSGFLLYISKVNPLGWVLGVINLVFFRILQVKILRRGKILKFILNIVLWLLVLFAFLMIIYQTTPSL